MSGAGGPILLKKRVERSIQQIKKEKKEKIQLDKEKHGVVKCG